MKQQVNALFANDGKPKFLMWVSEKSNSVKVQTMLLACAFTTPCPLSHPCLLTLTLLYHAIDGCRLRSVHGSSLVPSDFSFDSGKTNNISELSISCMHPMGIAMASRDDTLF